MSSFVTLQLTQKLDAYGISTARVYWTIGPRVCAAEGGTLFGTLLLTQREIVCVCVCVEACMQARAAARLQAAPPAVAPGLLCTPAGQGQRRRAGRWDMTWLDTDCSSTKEIPRAIETVPTWVGGGFWIGLGGRRALSIVYCLFVPPALNDYILCGNETSAAQISFDMCRPPPFCEWGRSVASPMLFAILSLSCTHERAAMSTFLVQEFR